MIIWNTVVLNFWLVARDKTYHVLDKMTKCEVLWHDEKVTEVISSAELTTNLR